MKTRVFLLILFLLCCPTAEAAESTLPKVILIGDSIRLSYTATVSKELSGIAEVISPKPNGQDSRNVLAHLNAWVILQKPDIVHFNCGIHDTKRFNASGKFQVSPEQYEQNLRSIVSRIRDETKATVIFATSTPILDERAAQARAGRDYELLNASIQQYNDIAIKVMQELNVPVNDLHTVLTTPPAPHTMEQLMTQDGVHLSLTAQELLGQKVAKAIKQHIAPTEKQ